MIGFVGTFVHPKKTLGYICSISDALFSSFLSFLS